MSAARAGTQPFDEDLHQRVVNLQNDLFDQRELNAVARVEKPREAEQASLAIAFPQPVLSR